ncbi:DUF4166 domain-containing protein [Ramlibacter aurantiacus]|nr:DUF4166 domain-containing protein [Ramlibacter aurantiacus]
MAGGWRKLHPSVRAFHELHGSIDLIGRVEAPSGLLRALLAHGLRIPTRGGPLRVHLRHSRDEQVWTRQFPRGRLRSSLRPHARGVAETLGPIRLVFALREELGDLVMVLDSIRVWGLPWPTWLWPRLVARERGGEGRLQFELRAELPLIGEIAGCRGWVDLPRQTIVAPAADPRISAPSAGVLQ